MLWPHTREELQTFLTELNQAHKNIKFTAEVSSQSCNFLDITIYKSPTFLRTGILSTKIYYKPTNTFTFPLGSSHMPHSIHKGIAVGEMTRVIRNTTSPSLQMYYGRKLIKHFKRRKYPSHILRQLRSMLRQAASYTPPTTKKRRMEKPLPFITHYSKYKPPINSIISKYWGNIYNTHHFYPLYPNNPFVVYRNHRNLKTLLSSKRRHFGGTPKQVNLHPSKSKPFKFLKFNHPRPFKVLKAT